MRIALALLSGLITSLAFPSWAFNSLDTRIGILAWVALVPLLHATSLVSRRRAFLLGWLAGFAFFRLFEMVIQTFFAQQALKESKIRFTILHTIGAGIVRIAQVELPLQQRAAGLMFLENYFCDLLYGFILEHTAVAAQTQ